MIGGLLALALAGGAQAEAPKLGVPAGPALIKAWDISIAPDGSGLPPGRGTVAQGALLFQEKCAGCHGPAGVGGAADRLTGGVGSLASPHPIKTAASYWPFATTLFDYVRRAMPIPRPESLSNDEVYALCAYLLSVDHIVGANTTLDAVTLPKVRMPNRDGFVPLWPPHKAW